LVVTAPCGLWQEYIANTSNNISIFFIISYLETLIYKKTMN